MHNVYAIYRPDPKALAETLAVLPFEPKAAHCLDSYKLGHFYQYPDNTNLVYSNWTARSDRHSPIPKQYSDGKVVVYGVQGTWKEIVGHYNRTFFSRPKEDVLAEFKRRQGPFSGNPDANIDHIGELHDLGFLPCRLKSIKEGSAVNIGIPSFTIRNTRQGFGWLTNSLETILSNESWKAMTVATITRAYRKICKHYAELTGAPMEFIDWQLHCFADRGMAGMHDAAKGNSAHSLFSLGSDSVSAVDWIEQMYGDGGAFIAGSVPATEHSVMCMGGKETEIETFRRLISKVYPNGIVSIVSDTWDFFRVITEFTKLLKEDILARGKDAFGNSKVVFRPDSGDPADIICGTARVVTSLPNFSLTPVIYEGKYYECIDKDSRTFEWVEVEPTPEMKGAVQCLWDEFGGTMTDKGYKMLCDRVGLIYGDSITPTLADEILRRLMEKGFASNNIVFGIGSFTYQYITRDTFGFAMKATYGIIGDEGVSIKKDPKTDPGKKSAEGLLRVERVGDDYILHSNQTWEQEEQGELGIIYDDGVFYNQVNFAEVKAVALATV